METAESANRAKSQFLSQMSHEIRTPMNEHLSKPLDIDALVLTLGRLIAEEKQGKS